MANTTYTAAQAVARSKSYTRFQTAMCLMFVKTVLTPTVASPYGYALGDANRSWAYAQHKRYTANPPAGAPVYWRSGIHGHIALSLGGGYCRSTDWDTNLGSVHGHVGTVSIARITRAWGMTYRGWSTDYAGLTIPGLGGTATAYPPTMAVDKSAVIYAHNLRPGARNADVARFEKALWNYLGGAYRLSIVGSKAAVGDGYYGTLTSQMCSNAYAKAGMPRASYPGGTALLKVLGFTNARV